MSTSPTALHFVTAPKSLTMNEFTQRFGAVYEHSPWIAELTWQSGIDETHSEVTTLARAMAQTLDAASDEHKLQLINAHPDLAGKAAREGDLTDESCTEQSSAGLDCCNENEFLRFQSLNDAYKNKFGMPFIMAVRGSNRHQILAGFEERLPNDHDKEFTRAIQEINRIALFRLQAMALLEQDTNT
ncbi:MAG: 2-oxo-4-hydroxy-4-carboxy-5-ureidoimidazoline decarboxylase [Granulosicoccus sp.]